MKKATFTGLVLSLLVAVGAPHQRASHPEGERVDKRETMTNSDTEPQVRELVDLGMEDPSGLSDEDAIRLIRQFVGTPWENPESREGLALSVDTAEGQLYLACLYARAFFLLRPRTSASERPAAKVVDCCQRALALKPRYAEAYIVAAQGFRVLRRFKDAEAALESAIALRPNWTGSYCQLAYVLVDEERYSDALAASQQEVRLSQQYGISGSHDDYRGPVRMHSENNDILRLDQIQFKIEHPNDVWLPNERIRALGLNHDPIGWLNPRNTDHR
jgi:tetratricopeptide (TPR) repeat protein